MVARLATTKNPAKAYSQSKGERMFQMILTRFLLTLATLCLLTVGFGCSDTGPRSCRVSGEVTIDGVPVQEGAISFDIVDPADLPGGAIIINGRYETQLSPGRKIVRISANNPDPSLGPDEAAPDIVPQKYQDEPPEIDVQTSGVHDFHLTSD
jgi:hypothetical protein